VANGRLKPQFAHHRLLEYARDADLELGADAEDLLQRLSHVLYAGRYPIAKAAAGSPEPRALDYPAGVDHVWGVLEHLESVLRATGAPCLPAVDLRARYRPPGYDV
jgi:hypothetical protein